MLNGTFNIIVLFFCVVTHRADGFWWGSPEPSSTPAPAQVMYKQIPLTYFRTYTYQPVQPFNAPYFAQGLNVGGGGAPSIGHLGRFDPFTGKFHYQQIGEPSLLTKKTTTSTTTTTTTPAPTTTTPTTTTTTTTTTTPVPTTTTTPTTTSTTPSTTSPPPPPTTTTTTTARPTPRLTTTSAFSSGNRITPPHLEPLITEYPAYNRRMYPSPYSPPHYYRSSQYPHSYDYSLPLQQQQQQRRVPVPLKGGRQHIQYVPCMCPISVGMVSNELDEGLPHVQQVGAPPQSVFLSRTTPDDDDDMELPAEEEAKKDEVPTNNNIENVANEGEQLQSHEKPIAAAPVTEAISAAMGGVKTQHEQESGDGEEDGGGEELDSESNETFGTRLRDDSEDLGLA